MSDFPLTSTDLTWLAGLARALLHEPGAADDLAQDTAIAAMRRPIPAGVPIRAWLRAIAQRLAARRFRGDARRQQREQRASSDEVAPDSTELVERAEIAELVTAAARGLPEPFRRTILLRFLDGRTPEEIAQLDGNPVDTVRWRVRRALTLLREELMRSDDRDWQAWCALLVPLADPSRAAGVATVGVSATSVGAVASWSVMKTMLVTGTAMGCLALWLALISADDGGVAKVSSKESVPVRSVESKVRVAAESAEESERAVVSDPLSEEAASKEERGAFDLIGIVVDADGDPVSGATVYVVSSKRPRRRRWATPVTRTVSSGGGNFRLPASEWGERSDEALELGVSANGFLRRVMALDSLEPTDEGIRVVLERGGVLWGRVLDESGLPVVGLELLVHTVGAGVYHVSPSQRSLRASRYELANARSSYQQCRATTDANGRVEFAGLPSEELRITPMQPGWVIGQPRAEADGSYHEWTAYRRLGVRLTVVDQFSGRPVEKAAATFSFKVDFANGESTDLGQWVGRGRGEASFVLGEGELPGLEKRTVTRVVFYGTARAGEGPSVDWIAEPIEDPEGAMGVAEVRVEIDTFASRVAEAEIEKVGSFDAAKYPRGMVELDVRYADGTLFEGELDVRWTARPESAPKVEVDGQSKLKPVSVGRYRLEVVAGLVTLDVDDARASGTLRPIRKEMRCFSERPSLEFFTLPRGGRVRIPRPEGWRGEWFVRASWREPGTEEWQGSWGYSTANSAMQLGVMRPAEWKFELRRDSALEANPLIRTAVVRDGQTAEVR